MFACGVDFKDLYIYLVIMYSVHIDLRKCFRYLLVSIKCIFARQYSLYKQGINIYGAVNMRDTNQHSMRSDKRYMHSRNQFSDIIPI